MCSSINREFHQDRTETLTGQGLNWLSRAILLNPQDSAVNVVAGLPRLARAVGTPLIESLGSLYHLKNTISCAIQERGIKAYKHFISMCRDGFAGVLGMFTGLVSASKPSYFYHESDLLDELSPQELALVCNKYEIEYNIENTTYLNKYLAILNLINLYNTLINTYAESTLNKRHCSLLLNVASALKTKNKVFLIAGMDHLQYGIAPCTLNKKQINLAEYLESNGINYIVLDPDSEDPIAGNCTLAEARVICLGEMHFSDDHRNMNAQIINLFYADGDIVFTENSPIQRAGQLKYVEEGVLAQRWDIEHDSPQYRETTDLITSLYRLVKGNIPSGTCINDLYRELNEFVIARKEKAFSPVGCSTLF